MMCEADDNDLIPSEGEPDRRLSRPVALALPLLDPAFDDLPDAAKNYVQRIEQIVGVPVRSISVGPARDQTIVK